MVFIGSGRPTQLWRVLALGSASWLGLSFPFPRKKGPRCAGGRRSCTAVPGAGAQTHTALAGTQHPVARAASPITLWRKACFPPESSAPGAFRQRLRWGAEAAAGTPRIWSPSRWSRSAVQTTSRTRALKHCPVGKARRSCPHCPPQGSRGDLPRCSGGAKAAGPLREVLAAAPPSGALHSPCFFSSKRGEGSYTSLARTCFKARRGMRGGGG